MQTRIFRQIATEMVDNGPVDTIPDGWGPDKKTAYYRHPDPTALTQVTIAIGNTKPTREERIDQLSRELRRRFHTPLRGYDYYTGEPWINHKSDPYGVRSGVRVWLKKYNKQ